MAVSQSDGKWRATKHLAEIDAVIRRAIIGAGPRIVVIEAPPRHGKSEYCSHWLPQWYLSLYPDRKIILTSYEATFARSWGRRDRDSMTELKGFTGLQVNRGQASAAEWGIEGHDGGMKTAGAGGPITGKGADLLIVDDPIKNAEDAMSPTIREKLWDWWQTTASTRLEPGGVAVIIATRWHKEDLSGKLIEAADSGDGEPITRLHLPAIAGENDQLGRQPGEALWPERWPIEEMLKRQKAMDEFWWSSLYQQDPGRHGSMEWPDHYFANVLVDEFPDAFELGVIAVDPSKGKEAKRGDYSGIIFVGLAGGKLWVDASLERRPTEQIVSDGIDLAHQYGSWLHGFAIEVNQFQELLVGEFERQVAERKLIPLPIFEITNTVNKKLRISRLGPYFGGGSLRIRNNAGGRLLVEQCRNFSQRDVSGVHDDGPDALEMAIRTGIEIQGGSVSDDGLGDRLGSM